MRKTILFVAMISALVLAACAGESVPPPEAQAPLMVATLSDKTDAVPLHQATVVGDVFIFLDYNVQVGTVASVDFFVDDPAFNNLPFHSELTTPYDFNGTGTLFNSRILTNAIHNIVARVNYQETNIETLVSGAVFTVDNGAEALPTPTPTVVPTPTAIIVVATPTPTPLPPTPTPLPPTPTPDWEAYNAGIILQATITYQLNATAIPLQATAVVVWQTATAPTPTPLPTAVPTVTPTFPPPPIPIPFDLNEIGPGSETDLLMLNLYIGEVTGTTCRIGPATASSIVEFIIANGPIVALEELIPADLVSEATVNCLNGFTRPSLAGGPFTP